MPLPGIDPRRSCAAVRPDRGGILDFFNTFSGGSLERMSLIALGVMPYITASIVVQLGDLAVRRRWRRSRRKARPGARSSTSIPATAPSFLRAIQGYFIAVGLEGLRRASGLRRWSTRA